MHARRSPQRGLCARGKRSSVKVAVRQSSRERLFRRARRIFGSPKTGLCAWRKSFLVRCESWRSQTRTRRRTFHYSRIVEMRARAMRDDFSHFIKCEMRGKRTGAAKSMGLALGSIAASHFFKKVRSECVGSRCGRLSDS